MAWVAICETFWQMYFSRLGIDSFAHESIRAEVMHKSKIRYCRVKECSKTTWTHHHHHYQYSDTSGEARKTYLHNVALLFVTVWTRPSFFCHDKSELSFVHVFACGWINTTSCIWKWNVLSLNFWLCTYVCIVHNITVQVIQFFFYDTYNNNLEYYFRDSS